MQAFEHAPAREQSGVESHGCLKRLHGALPLPQPQEAVPAFLVEQGEPRVVLLQALQADQCLGNSLQAALVGRQEIEHVAVCRECNSERFGRRKRLTMTLCLA
jgi:hypothetical protein